MKFPMFIELEGKKIVAAGAGTIGTRRICALQDFGAEITVVAPEISEKVKTLWQKGDVSWISRCIEKEDLEQAFFVVAATDKRAVNHQIYEWCVELGILVNVADKKEECSFYFPGLAKEGNLVAGICAGGKNHKLARTASKDVRELFHERYPAEGQKNNE